MIELGTMGRSNSKVTAADGTGFVHAGKGDAVAAREIAKAKGDGKDNIVFIAGQDVYTASSSHIAVNWASDVKDLPYSTEKFTDMMTITTPAGEKVTGAVVLRDSEASTAAGRKKAEADREQRRRESTPYVIGGAVATLAGVAMGMFLAGVGAAVGVGLTAVGFALVLGSVYYTGGQL